MVYWKRQKSTDEINVNSLVSGDGEVSVAVSTTDVHGGLISLHGILVDDPDRKDISGDTRELLERADTINVKLPVVAVGVTIHDDPSALDFKQEDAILDTDIDVDLGAVVREVRR